MAFKFRELLSRELDTTVNMNDRYVRALETVWLLLRD